MIDQSEDAWLDRLRADGVQALAQVLSHYRERLVRMVDFRLDARLLGRLDVDDVLQEVYLASARRLADFLANPAVPVFVWVRTMTQQVLADVHRRHVGAQKRDVRRDVPLHRRQGDGTTSFSIASRLADSLTSPSGAAARADMRQHLRHALEEMDPIDREVLALRHFEDLTNGEVAAVLGLGKAAASKPVRSGAEAVAGDHDRSGCWCRQRNMRKPRTVVPGMVRENVTTGNNTSEPTAHPPPRQPETIDEIVEEFLARVRGGHQPTVDEYASRFPGLADELAEILPAVAAMERLGSQEKASRQMARLAGAAEGTGVERLGDFRIIREIGRGGMGVVYEAEQESLGRHVAVKVISAELAASPADRERFQREAEAAARLYHTNIVPVFGVGRHGELPYYVMQLVDGVGLDTVLGEATRRQRTKERREPSGTALRDAVERLFGVDASAPGSSARQWRKVAELGLQVAGALDHAHRHGVVHRDIKPSNLLLDREGRVWVTDFGLARHETADRVTRTGALVGTFRYMAPEQFGGSADHRSDVHALGLTLYELLTLGLPFTSGDHGELVRQKTASELPSPRRANPAIPRDLATIVGKACALRPEHRYQTAAALARDFELFLDGRPIRARRITPVERFWRWGRRNPLVASLASLAVVLTVAVAAVAAVGYAQTRKALGQAERNALLAGENLGKAVAAAERAESEWRRAETNIDLAFEAFEQIMDDMAARGMPRALSVDTGEGVQPAPVSAADAELFQVLLGVLRQVRGAQPARRAGGNGNGLPPNGGHPQETGTFRRGSGGVWEGPRHLPAGGGGHGRLHRSAPRHSWRRSTQSAWRRAGRVLRARRSRAMRRRSPPWPTPRPGRELAQSSSWHVLER